MIRRLLVTLSCLTLLVAGFGVRPAGAQVTEAGSSQAIRFRRVLVPTASRGDWPLGQHKYLPIGPDEFEKLLAASVVPEAVANRLAVAPRISHAEYEAYLDGNRLTKGRGTLWVEHVSEARALLRLDPCNLAVSKAVWADEIPRPAVFGLGVGGSLDLLVEQTGQLEIDWSLAGRRESTGGLTFPLRFPACPVNHLLLETRDDVDLLVDHGAVLDVGRGEDGTRHWRIELGNRFECELRVVALGGETVRRGLSLLREQTGYDVSPRGIEVSSEWNLEIHHEPLGEIGLYVDEELQLATAKLGEEPVPWTVAPREGGGPSRVLLRLPKPVQGTGLVLRLGALAPLRTDRPCRLPRIRPEGVFWQEGGATLFVQAPLVVERLGLVGCRQTGVEFVETPRKGESFQLQLYHPEATAELDLVEPKNRITVVSGTSVQWSEEEIRATVRADIHLKGGIQFRINAALGPRWMVDTVESAPADAVDEWMVETDDQGQRHLVVRLIRALAPGRPIRLSVNARRLGSSLGDALLIDSLSPLRFDAKESDWRLVGLRTSDAFEVELVGRAASHTLARNSLQPGEAELLDTDESATLVRLEGDAPNLQARLAPRRPRFVAKMEVEARVAGKTFDERYRVRCQSESARLDRVVVWLSRQRKEPLNWVLDDEGAVQVSSRRWTSDEQLAAGLSAEGEAWEIRLSPPIIKSLVITADRKSAFSSEMIPSLASVPDAEIQTGLLTVHAEPGTSIQVDNRRLRQMPPEPVPADRFTTARAVYRYDPWREVGRAGEPPLAVSGRAAEEAIPAMIWNASLDTRFDSDGVGSHVAVFFLENLGLDALRIQLPDDLHGDGPLEVWIDRQRIAGNGRHAAAPSETEQSNPEGEPIARSSHDELHVSLPAGKRYLTIMLAFTSKGRRLGSIGTLPAPWPELDVAVLNRSWSVWLPPGYTAYGSGRRGSPSASNWSERLLGPLGRSADQSAFDPFAADHWRTLFGGADGRRDGLRHAEAELEEAPDSLASPSATTNSQTAGGLETMDSGSPWTHESLPGQEPGDRFGWQAVAPSEGQGTTAVRYYHERSLRLAGSIAFLLAVSGGWWLARNRTLALLVGAGCAGLTALWAPEPYVFAASGIVLGLLFCLAFRLVHRRLAPQSHTQPRRAVIASPPSTISSTIPWGLALLVSTLGGGIDSVARGGQPAREAGSAMYRVFIPVDAEKKPVGGKYYLPEPLFAELHRLAAAQRGLPRGWLLSKAVYRGELVREPAGERFAVEQIRAQFDLHVFSPSTRVHIPLERSGANLLPDGVSLDGQAVEVEWSEDNRALVFEVAEPGQYQLELRMRPRMRSESPSGFDLNIPPVPIAQLELALPSAAPTVEVPTARGDVRREDSPPRIVAELGPSGLISIRWQSRSVPAGSGPAIDVEELLWMKVQPGSVLIEAKWKLAVMEGQVQRFRLVTDPRMRLLPLEGSRSPAVQTSVGDNELLQLVLEWPEPLQDETIVSARFLLTGASGVGNLRFPQIDILDGRMTRRWMAVSVSEALQFERSGAKQLSPVPSPEFLSAWGATESVPSFVYQLPSGTPDWALATRPREPTMSVTSNLTLRFTDNATNVEFDAKLDANAGYRFQYRVAGPKELEVARASLLSEDVDRAVRWSQDASGVISLFLSGPVSGAQQLVLSGRLPPAFGQPVPLPAFQVEGGQLMEGTLHLLRGPGVLVELQNENGLSPIAPPASETAEPVDWIPVGSYRMAPGTEATASVLAVVNEPEITGKEIVRLSVNDGVWYARWECRFEIANGLLEEVTVAASANWGNQFQASSGTKMRVEPAQGTRRELCIRPKQPVKEHWWAWVSGKLQQGVGERVSVPDIGVKGIRGLSRFVILPRQVDGLAMDWQVQGLQPVSLAQVAPELAPEQSSLAAFRVVNRPFSAELPELAVSWGEGRVGLAEYAVEWQESGLVGGVARFDIDPGTRRFCEIHFPDSTRPLLIEVNGGQAPLTELLEPGVLRIPLGAPGISQRVEIVFESPLAQPLRGKLELMAPSIDELPVEQTLWTVAMPAGRMVDASQAGEKTTGWQVALARLESLGRLVERATTAAGDDSADTVGWYRHWLRLWNAARDAASVEVERISVEADRRIARERLGELTRRQSDVAGRLGDGQNTTGLLPSKDAAGGAFDAWHAALFRGRCLVYHKAAGQSSEITVEVTPTPVAFGLGRVVAGMGWIALLGLFAFTLRRGLLVESFRRWPQTMGVLVGLIWWLWLSPSVLGLVLAIACVATSLRTGWRSISRPVSDSSVVPIVRS